MLRNNQPFKCKCTGSKLWWCTSWIATVERACRQMFHQFSPGAFRRSDMGYRRVATGSRLACSWAERGGVLDFLRWSSGIGCRRDRRTRVVGVIVTGTAVRSKPVIERDVSESLSDGLTSARKIYYFCLWCSCIHKMTFCNQCTRLESPAIKGTWINKFLRK